MLCVLCNLSQLVVQQDLGLAQASHSGCDNAQSATRLQIEVLDPAKHAMQVLFSLLVHMAYDKISLVTQFLVAQPGMLWLTAPVCMSVGDLVGQMCSFLKASVQECEECVFVASGQADAPEEPESADTGLCPPQL